VNVRFANCKVRVISELLSSNECVRVSVSEVSERVPWKPLLCLSRARGSICTLHLKLSSTCNRLKLSDVCVNDCKDPSVKANEIEDV
jgi:hypothetical protein